MKAKNPKKSFLLSALSLILCVSMFVGTTFAWFTDTVKSENNKIVTGNLDIELYYMNDETADWTLVDEDTNIFKKDTLWEPGHTEVVKLKVVNEGSLALKYQLGVNIASEQGSVNQLGNEFKLSDYIKYGVVAGEESYTRDTAIAAVDATANALNIPYAEAGTLLSEGESIVTMVVYMPTTVGNEANAAKNAAVPTIMLGLNLYATQVASEEDSFDKYYDAGTVWYGEADVTWYDPDATEYTLTTPEQFAGFAAIVNGTATAPAVTYTAESTAATIHDNFAGKTVYLGGDLNLNGTAWTPIGRFADLTKTTDFTYAFRGTFDGQNHTISNLNVSNQGWAGLFGIAYKATIKNVKVVGVELESSRMTGAIVGQIYGSIDNCHVVDAEMTVTPNWVESKSVYDNGDKVGGIVGWIGDNNNNHTLTNCSVDGLTARAYRDLAGLAGYAAYSTVFSGNKVANIALTGDQSINFYGHNTYNVNDYWGKSSVSSTGVTVIDGGNNTAVNVQKTTVNVIANADDLSKAFTNGGEYKLAQDLALDASYKIANGVSVALDLNGKTITGTSSATGANFYLIDVYGTLSVKNGTVTTTHTGADMGWGNCTGVFHLNFDGKLTLDQVNVENLGGTAMAYGIDLTNIYADDDSKLMVTNSTLKSSYIAVRVFNNGNGVHDVEIADSKLEGKLAFWVQYYDESDDGMGANTAAKRANLKIDIYNNNNTFSCAEDKVSPILYGFNVDVYFTPEGLQITSAPVEIPVAPLEEDFLFPAGTNAVLYKDMLLTGDVQIVHEENVVLGLSNVVADLDHDVIVRKSGGAICISDCSFTLTDGAKLISVGEGGDAYQVFLINVTVNGELLTDANAGQYLEGINWFGAYPTWPNT